MNDHRPLDGSRGQMATPKAADAPGVTAGGVQSGPAAAEGEVAAAGLAGSARAFVERLRKTAVGRFFYGYLIDHEGVDMASTVAFNTLLSLFPLFGAILAVLGLVLRNGAHLADLSRVMFRLLPEREWQEQIAAIFALQDNAPTLSIVSAIGLFWIGPAFVASLARAFNKLYHVPPRDEVGQRVLALGLIILFAVLLVITVIASNLAAVLVQLTRDVLAPVGLASTGWGLGGRVLALATSLFAAFVLFLALYWALPNVRLRFRDVWPGALLAAVLLVVVSQLFHLYASFAPTSRYGNVFGLLLLLTTWIYLFAHIMLLGAALNAFRCTDWSRGAAAPRWTPGARRARLKRFIEERRGADARRGAGPHGA